MIAILGLFLICATSCWADYDITVKEHCHKEQIVTEDENGTIEVSNTGEDVCESSPNDWISNDNQ